MNIIKRIYKRFRLNKQAKEGKLISMYLIEYNKAWCGKCTN